MLADRLKLAVHRETRPVSVYALVIAPGGPKLKEGKPAKSREGSKGPDGIAFFDHDNLRGQNAGMDALLFHISRELRRTVLNETGLNGRYDFTLQNPPGATLGIDNAAAPLDSYEPALSAALESQLGLKLEPRTTPLEVLVIDHVERPSTSQSQGAAPATLPQYQDVSVKLDQDGTTSLRTGAGVIRQRVQIIPGEFHGTNNSLREMIRMAYGIKDYQIFGAPDWLSTDLYDIDAKSQDAAIAALKKLPEDQRETAGRAMLQQLLADRFQIQSHFETKQLPAYSLVVLDSSKLHAATGSCDPPAPGPRTLSNNAPPCGQIADYLPGQLTGAKASVPQLANSLSNITGRPVQDKTNLTAKYDIHLSWDPQYRTDKMPPLDRTEPANPSLLAAIQNQLGLELQPETAPVNLLVIDHVEKPSETTARLQ